MIRLLSDRPQSAARLAGLLAEHGIFVSRHSLREGMDACCLLDTGGVILDGFCSPHGAHRLCRALRAAYPLLPIAAWVPVEDVPELPADLILRGEGDETAEDAYRFCVAQCGVCTGANLRLLTLRGNEEIESFSYIGYPLRLPHKEALLLRLLMYCAPNPLSVEQIGSFLSPETEIRANGIAVSVRKINQRALQIDSRPLIVCEYARGYRLRTGV